MDGWLPPAAINVRMYKCSMYHFLLVAFNLPSLRLYLPLVEIVFSLFHPQMHGECGRLHRRPNRLLISHSDRDDTNKRKENHRLVYREPIWRANNRLTESPPRPLPSASHERNTKPAKSQPLPKLNIARHPSLLGGPKRTA